MLSNRVRVIDLDVVVAVEDFPGTDFLVGRLDGARSGADCAALHPHA